MRNKDMILLQIKRNFSKDEIVQALTKQISDLEFRLGVLKSERDELHYKYHNEKSVDKSAKEEYRKDVYVQTLLDNLKSMSKTCKKYKEEFEYWQRKYYAEVSKNLKLTQNEEERTTL